MKKKALSGLHFVSYFFKRGVGTKLFPGDCCGWLTNVSHLFFVVFYIEGTFFPLFLFLNCSASMCHCPHIFKKILFNARKQKDDQIGTNIDRWYWYRSKAERFVFLC